MPGIDRRSIACASLRGDEPDAAPSVRRSFALRRRDPRPPWQNAALSACRSPPMRLSQFHLRTSKETPADAEVISHKLMLKAGMVRKLAAGLYTWSPLGLRVLRKVEGIVREEMDARRRDRTADAVDPAEGTVGGNRALAEVRRPVAEDQGSQGGRVLLRPDPRGSHHRLRAQRTGQLQAAAGEFLPDPDQVPRRDPPALRGDARARIPDEGRVLVPPRRRRPGARVRQHARYLQPHLHPPGTEVPRGAGRFRRDRRRRLAGIPRAGRLGRGCDRVLGWFRLRRQRRDRERGRAGRAAGRVGSAAQGRHADAEDLRGRRRADGHRAAIAR